MAPKLTEARQEGNEQELHTGMLGLERNLPGWPLAVMEVSRGELKQVTVDLGVGLSTGDPGIP